MKNTFGGFERFVIRDAETGTGYMDSFDTIKECLDRIKDYEEMDKKACCYTQGFYEVYDNQKEEIAVYGFEL